MAHYAASQPNSVAFASDSSRLHYIDLPERIDEWAAAMVASGVAKGDRVAVFGDSRPECFIAFLACARIGAIYLGLNPKYSIRELKYVMGDAGPRLVLALHSPADLDLDDKLIGLANEVEAVPPIYTRDHVIGVVSKPLNEFLERSTRQVIAEPVAPKDPVALVYTSGSTGAPKGALLSQSGMIRSACVSWETWYGRLSPLRTIAQHPINHVGWLVCECISGLVAGGSLYFRERFNGGDSLKAIEEHRLNLWVAFPSMLMLALEAKEFATADLSSLKRIALGSMASVDLMRKFRERTDVTFSVSYGLTEASGGAVTYTPDYADLETVATTIGIPVPGVDLRVVDLDGRDVASGQAGELLVHDESVFLGYLNRPDATAATIDKDGWLHTSDAVSMDTSGTYRMVGRLKEMFKSGGYNVYPTEIEAVLSSHPAISAACVVQTDDKLWGEVGVAFVVLRSGAGYAASDLRAFARERLANYKVPKEFVIRDELPKLPNGKFDKVRLRDEANHLHPTAK